MVLIMEYIKIMKIIFKWSLIEGFVLVWECWWIYAQKWRGMNYALLLKTTVLQIWFAVRHVDNYAYRPLFFYLNFRHNISDTWNSLKLKIFLWKKSFAKFIVRTVQPLSFDQLTA